MHSQSPFPKIRSLYTAEFKAEVITALLFNIAVTADVSTRYGVPPSHVRRWIRQIITQLCDVFRNSDQSCPGADTGQESSYNVVDEFAKLNHREMQTLLNNLDESVI